MGLQYLKEEFGFFLVIKVRDRLIQINNILCNKIFESYIDNLGSIEHWLRTGKMILHFGHCIYYIHEPEQDLTPFKSWFPYLSEGTYPMMLLRECYACVSVESQ